MIKGDPRTGEGLLDRRRNARGVPVGGDWNRAAIIELREGGAYVLGDRVRITPLGDLAVLDVPPDRRLRLHVLRLRRAGAAHVPAAAHCRMHPSVDRTVEKEEKEEGYVQEIEEEEEEATSTACRLSWIGTEKGDWRGLQSWLLL